MIQLLEAITFLINKGGYGLPLQSYPLATACYVEDRLPRVSGGHPTIHSASIRLYKQAWLCMMNLRGVLDVGLHILSIKGIIACWPTYIVT